MAEKGEIYVADGKLIYADDFGDTRALDGETESTSEQAGELYIQSGERKLVYVDTNGTRHLIDKNVETQGNGPRGTLYVAGIDLVFYPLSDTAFSVAGEKANVPEVTNVSVTKGSGQVDISFDMSGWLKYYDHDVTLYKDNISYKTWPKSQTKFGNSFTDGAVGDGNSYDYYLKNTLYLPSGGTKTHTSSTYTVSFTNNAPNADLYASNVLGRNINWSAFNSNDPDGDTLEYSFAQYANGNYSSWQDSATFSAFYSSYNTTYTCEVRVRDTKGNIDTATASATTDSSGGGGSSDGQLICSYPAPRL
ncbi:hypothetical protein [Salinibacter ruber]|uniref:hypothetical protein n=1 Tax=Salinibacter ruber TaxID=146919 RepID=UPI00207343A8|nr:hypothetical protein [Salinibacter ruber]